MLGGGLSQLSVEFRSFGLELLHLALIALGRE